MECGRERVRCDGGSVREVGCETIKLSDRG